MYSNFTATTLAVATQLESAGFDIHVPSHDADLSRRLNWFQFRKNGRIGYYSGDFLADHRWSMPIHPSREHGSSMFVEAAENAPNVIEAATIITQESNFNPIVGTHKNYASNFALTHYVRV